MKFILVQRQARHIEQVKRYLPANYFVFFARNDHMVLAGEDDHGWTAEDYVIPRLASGLIASRLITPREYADEYMIDVLPTEPQ